METCYGCMYNFNKKESQPESSSKIESPKSEDSKTEAKTESKNIMIDDTITKKHIPEFFELEPFSYIEEQDNIKKAAHAKPNQTDNENIVIKLKIPRSVLEKYIV